MLRNFLYLAPIKNGTSWEKRICAALLCVWVGCIPSWLKANEAETTKNRLTLRDCYQLAHRQSETLKVKYEEINQASARKRAAFGTALPSINWLYTVQWQDTTRSVSDSTASVSSTFLADRLTNSRFKASLPLFHGGQEISAIQAASADTRRTQYELKRDEIALLEKVSVAFYQAILNQTDLLNVNSIIDQTQTRIKELKSRVQLGRSRDSEVLTAESQLANLLAEAARLRGAIVTSRENLSYLIGQDLGPNTLDDRLGLPDLPSPTEALAHAEKRSDLLALRELIQVKRLAVRYHRAGHWPWLDLTGTYYTHRAGFQSEIDWDLLFSLDVPIFKGGQVSAQVDQALSDWRSSRFELDRLSREIRSDVKVALASVASSREEALLLEDAFKKAQKSYEIQTKEYRLGLVNNLDVLAALNTMLEAKHNWDRALVLSKLQYIHLNAVMENFPELNP